MTMKQHPRALAVAVLVTGYLVGLVAYPRPLVQFLEAAPTARVLVAFTLPTTALVIDMLFRSLWVHDRVRGDNGAFEATYHAIILRVLLFVVALHVVVMIQLTGAADTLGLRLSAGRTVVVMLGAGMVAIGNLLPRTRPNIAVGVRTARTLSNRALWQQVHRVGGYATVAVGTVTAVAGFVLRHDAVGPVVTAAALCAAATVFISYYRHARA